MKFYEEEQLIQAMDKYCHSCFSIEELQQYVKPYEIQEDIIINYCDSLKELLYQEKIQ